ncbi:MAG: STAS domain-containing protein [Acidobacteriaceae bacterium]
MALMFKTREAGAVTVVDLSGTITMGEDAKALQAGVDMLLCAGIRKIVLNLEEVTSIDSSGLGELMSAHTAVKDLGGELKMIHLTHKVRDLLVITKLATVFDVQEDEAAAVASFA